jgi:hypothetical protein
MNEKIIPLFNTNISLNLPADYLFNNVINVIGTNFYRNEYSANRSLFDYNGVFYCYVYGNIDLLIS